MGLEIFMMMKIQTAVFWMQHGPLKHWYPNTSLHGVTIPKTTTGKTWADIEKKNYTVP
jgi:hypothetical protein